MRSRAILALVLAIACTAWPILPASAGPEKSPPPLGGNLRLDDLTPSPTDALDRQLFAPTAPAATPQSPPTSAPPASGPTAEQLQRELGRAAQSEADSPLVDIARTMHQVQQRIGHADSGDETQQMQVRILTHLDALLQQARSQCQACQGACQGTKQAVAQRQRVQQPKDIEPAKFVKRKNSGGGADPSRAIAGPDKVSPGAKVIHQPNMEEMHSLMKALWGELPQRQREQMLQQPVEEFLPKYELLIEQYFKRLAEPRQQPPTDRRP